MPRGWPAGLRLLPVDSQGCASRARKSAVASARGRGLPRARPAQAKLSRPPGCGGPGPAQALALRARWRLSNWPSARAAAAADVADVDALLATVSAMRTRPRASSSPHALPPSSSARPAPAPGHATAAPCACAWGQPGPTRQEEPRRLRSWAKGTADDSSRATTPVAAPTPEESERAQSATTCAWTGATGPRQSRTVVTRAWAADRPGPGSASAEDGRTKTSAEPGPSSATAQALADAASPGAVGSREAPALGRVEGLRCFTCMACPGRRASAAAWKGLSPEEGNAFFLFFPVRGGKDAIAPPPSPGRPVMNTHIAFGAEPPRSEPTLTLPAQKVVTGGRPPVTALWCRPGQCLRGRGAGALWAGLQVVE